MQHFRWFCHAYCLMDNHYHLVIETPEANLAKCMHRLNGIFITDTTDITKLGRGFNSRSCLTETS